MLKKVAQPEDHSVFITGEKIVSVIVPVFNEEKCIEGVVTELKNIMNNAHLNYEIIVVDDGSTDNSGAIMEKLKGVKIIKHTRNFGYGRSIKTGMKNAKGNIIVITDADGTYPNEIIPEFVNEIGQYDMVVGARSMRDKSIPLSRKPMKWILNKLANYLSGTIIPDLNSGLRAFKKDVALQFFKMFPSGFSFTTTITLAMHSDGYSVKYVPIKYRKREGKSKINPIKDTVNFIQLIGRTVMYFNPLKIFLPVSFSVLSGFLVSLFYDLFILENITEKTLILFLAFIQVSIIGLIADLIDKRRL